MAWYGDSWPVDQRNYTREQVTEERQMWEQNMEASNHVAFQHFQNFAPYGHNMVNMAAMPGFTGVKFPNGIMFSESPPSCLMSNEMPSTSSKVMPVEEPKNDMLDQIKPCWKAPSPIMPQQEKVLPEIPIRKSPDPPAPIPVSHTSKPSTSKASKIKAVKRPRNKNKKKAVPVTPPAVDEPYVSPYKCPICDKHFEFEASLKTHSLLHGGGGYLYKRALLEKSINLKSKIKKESAKIFQCTECGEWFAQSRILERHMKMHSGESPFQCPTCDKTYKCSASLKRHLVSHTGEKPYSCNICSKSFALKEYLQKHIKGHDEDRPYKCTSCERTFVLEKNLKTHLKAHATQQPYKCSTCNKAFSQQANLYRHMRCHLEGQ